MTARGPVLAVLFAACGLLDPGATDVPAVSSPDDAGMPASLGAPPPDVPALVTHLATPEGAVATATWHRWTDPDGTVHARVEDRTVTATGDGTVHTLVSTTEATAPRAGAPWTTWRRHGPVCDGPCIAATTTWTWHPAAVPPDGPASGLLTVTHRDPDHPDPWVRTASLPEAPLWSRLPDDRIRTRDDGEVLPMWDPLHRRLPRAVLGPRPSGGPDALRRLTPDRGMPLDLAPPGPDGAPRWRSADGRFAERPGAGRAPSAAPPQLAVPGPALAAPRDLRRVTVSWGRRTWVQEVPIRAEIPAVLPPGLPVPVGPTLDLGLPDDLGPRALLDAVVARVRERVHPGPVFGPPTPEGTLARGVGDCDDLAGLAAAVLRHHGLPAEVVHGWLVEPGPARGDDATRLVRHAWVEITGLTTLRLPVDPALGQPVADAAHLPDHAAGAPEHGISPGFADPR